MFRPLFDAFKPPIKSYWVKKTLEYKSKKRIQVIIILRIAQGLEKVVKIRIEPSIFEFLGWYDKGLPTFVNLEALLQFGYNIETSYKPLLPIDRLQPDENYTDYYQRSFNVTKYLTNLHQSEGS